MDEGTLIILAAGFALVLALWFACRGDQSEARGERPRSKPHLVLVHPRTVRRTLVIDWQFREDIFERMRWRLS
jgi:hypothetical protein